MVHHHGFLTFQRSCITLCEQTLGHTPGGWYPVCKVGRQGLREAGLLANRPARSASLSPHPFPLTRAPRSVSHTSPGRLCFSLHPLDPLWRVSLGFFPSYCNIQVSAAMKLQDEGSETGGEERCSIGPGKVNTRSDHFPLFCLTSSAPSFYSCKELATNFPPATPMDGVQKPPSPLLTPWKEAGQTTPRHQGLDTPVAGCTNSTHSIQKGPIHL